MKSKNKLKEIGIKNRVCYYFDDIINGLKIKLIIFYYIKNYMKVFQFIAFLIKLQQVQNHCVLG